MGVIGWLAVVAVELSAKWRLAEVFELRLLGRCDVTVDELNKKCNK